MADSEFLRQIDARVARTNELLEQDRKTWEASRGEHGQSLEDIRLELRQMSLRGERLVQGYLRALEKMSEQIDANTAAVRDMSDQIRANTRALLTLLDERGGGPAAAGA